MFSNKPLANVNLDDLKALLDSRVEESKCIDFKRDLPGNTDSDKREFCADVSSFANTNGGYMLFGIAESEGAATEIVGVTISDADATRLRFEQLLQSGVVPRLPNVEYKEVKISKDRSVLILHIERSWRGPHLVKAGDGFRACKRAANGKYSMDIDQLRGAFSQTSELSDRAKRWRNDRLSEIQNGNEVVLVTGRSRVVLHLVPLWSLGSESQLDVNDILGRKEYFRPIEFKSPQYRVNIDGVVSSLVPQSGVLGHGVNRKEYCQVFRSGSIELVTSRYFYNSRAGNWTGLNANRVESVLIQSIERYLRGLGELNVQLPVIVMVCICGCRDVYLVPDPDTPWSDPIGQFDRDLLVLPNVLINSYEENVSQSIRAICDSLWNAAGAAGSQFYDQSGKWKGTHR